MKVFGIGTDIVNISRLRKKLNRNGKKLKLKIFSQKEINYCEKKKDPVSSYAKRFAAKEALTKALGTGFGNGISLKNIEITNKKTGQPEIHLNGHVLKVLKKKVNNKSFNILLSLSDDQPWAQATVIILSK